jgi:hypothetical protein
MVYPREYPEVETAEQVNRLQPSCSVQCSVIGSLIDIGLLGPCLITYDAWGFSTADEIMDLQLQSNACAWHPARRSVDGDFGNYCNMLRAICKFGSLNTV